MKKFFSSLAVATMGGIVALSFNYFIIKKDTRETSSTGLPPNYPVKFVNMPNAAALEMTTDFTKAAEISLPAVVHVKTEYAPKMNQSYYFDPFQGLYYNDPRQQKPQVSSGSGVIISGDGYVVTNYHVVKDASKVEVVLYDKRTYMAKLIGTDAATDIALLKIEERNLPYLVYGNSDEVRVGEWVLAVGNPFNLTSTVTAGIVSAKARNVGILEYDPSKNIYPIESFIQTDAAVNPGNSGGALVSTTGQLIGINSAIASNTGSYTGYSFAVPVNIVKKVVNDLIEFGSVQRAFLGVSIKDIDSKLVEEKGLRNTKGVYVAGVVENGSASLAGIREGDVILKVGDVNTENVPELQEQISRFRPGDKVAIEVNREGEERLLLVMLKSKNGDTKLTASERKEGLNFLGGRFEPVSESDKKSLGIDMGVKITGLDAGKLRSAGVKEGFIITSIDKKRVSRPDEIKLILENKEGGVLIEGVYPNGVKAYYAFGL